MDSSTSHTPTTIKSTPDSTDPNYSAFSSTQKKYIIGLVAFAGWFSSLSSFIYFPVIPFLASDLSVPIEKINLTVTAYLIMSGIFPSLVGGAADSIGRRPVFIITLAMYVAANVGLALQSSFGALFTLRMLQSAGISGSYAVTYGVIGDLFTPAERGGYSGIVSFVLNTPPSIGPIVSGLLMLRWGWRSIFWFLATISPCCLFAIILFLPETSRNIVGDGSKAVKGWNAPPLPILKPPASKERGDLVSTSKTALRNCRFPNPLRSLDVLGNPGSIIIVGTIATYYMIYSCLQASLSTLFTQTYGASRLVESLAYIPFGVACAISALAYGKILDLEYRRTAKRHGHTVEKSKDHDLASFPIEEARLGSLKYVLTICCFLIVGYGWSVQNRVHMSIPLILQFFIGLTIQGVFTSLSTLLVDTHPKSPSAALAGANFGKCEIAAGGLAFLDVLIKRVRAGWTFVFFAATGLVSLPLLYLLQKRGLKWRSEKGKEEINREVGVIKVSEKEG